MANFSELIDMIAQGIDPTTGEVIDVEVLKRDTEFLASIKRLNRTYNKSRSGSKYRKFEELYPRHVVVMKEGYFYSVHNASAKVLNYVLDYKLVDDYWGRVTTGGPDPEKIAGALRDNGFSYIIVEGDVIAEEYNGRDSFSFLNLYNEGNNADAAGQSEAAVKKEAAFPYNLLNDILEDSTEFPENILERLDTALGTISTKYYRDRDILLFRYRDGESLQEIADRYELSRERIRQIINRGLKRLRRKAVREFLTGNADELLRSNSLKAKGLSELGEILRLRPEQIDRVEISRNQSISISELARRITAVKDSEQDGSIKYLHIANWLVSNGDLIEETSDSDSMKRRPTPRGEAKGIIVETRQNAKGKYTTVFLNENAQRYILASLDLIVDHIEHERS